MEILEAFKLVTLYALETVVIAMVGVTLTAGLYQLIRDQVHALREKRRERRAATPSVLQEVAERF